MAAMRTLFVKLIKDEAGGEMIEYGLVAGLVVASVIATVALVGKKVSTEWTTLKKAM